jgi:hypothetical protein
MSSDTLPMLYRRVTEKMKANPAEFSSKGQLPFKQTPLLADKKP